MMYLILVIMTLTGIFMATLAEFSWQNAVIGGVAATFFVLIYFRWIFPRKLPPAEFVVHLLLRLPLFLWYLSVDILKGTWQVTVYVVGIRQLDHPGIVKIPFGNHSDEAVGLVGHLVTVSPGSFLVDVDWEDRTMLVHYIDASNPRQLRADVEKYYRLWEYGSHIPQPRSGPSQDQGGTS
jgi:multisubunit Na+/H+ antiporter MnhE subunit